LVAAGRSAVSTLRDGLRRVGDRLRRRWPILAGLLGAFLVLSYAVPSQRDNIFRVALVTSGGLGLWFDRRDRNERLQAMAEAMRAAAPPPPPPPPAAIGEGR
jgi:hypothetical protein